MRGQTWKEAVLRDTVVAANCVGVLPLLSLVSSEEHVPS